MAATPFQQEAWSEYSIGMLILLLRIVVRCRLVGRKWDGDDYFTIAAVLFWTAELVMLELIGQYGTITGMSDEIAVTLTDDEVRRLEIGSKCLLAGWCLYTTLIWCLKGCMLFLLNRLTLNLRQQVAVKITAVACGLAYISTMIVLLTHCHPINRLWQVYPYPGDDCALNISKYLALVVTNIVTDLMILWIPLPLLWRVRLPLHRKILYGLWLCSGIFIVVATLLRCIICLQDAQSINLGTIWSIRETLVGILAVNAPILQPLVTRAIRRATTISGPSKKSTKGDDYNSGPSGSHQLSRLERKEKQNRIRVAMGMTTLASQDNDSDEEGIVQRFDPNARNNGVAVSSGSVDDGDGYGGGYGGGSGSRNSTEIQVTREYGVSKQYI